MKGHRGPLVPLRTPRVSHLAAGLAACVVLAFPTAAAAINRAQANRVAIAALKPSRQPGRVVLFGLPSALGPRARVVEAGTHHRSGRELKRSLKPIGRRQWLFWEDLDSGAMFDHPSRLLLVDDRTGKAGHPIAFNVYPVIDAHPVPFIDFGAERNPRYVVASKLPPPPRVSIGSVKARPADWLQASAAQAPAPLALPNGAFKDVCVLMIGDQGADPRMYIDFSLMRREAVRLGVGLVVAARSDTPGAPSATAHDLARTARELITRDHCKDILLYIAGHGSRGGLVHVGQFETLAGAGATLVNESYIDPTDIRRLIRTNPGANFKVKVDSCYSGNFTDSLRQDKRELPNLVVAEAASSSKQVSHFYGPAADLPGSMFTRADIAAWETFATTPASVTAAEASGGDLFAHMMATSFTDEQDYDPGTTPQLFENNPATVAPPPPPPPPAITGSGSFTYFDPPANTEIVFHVSFDKPTSGFDVEVPSGYRITNTLPPSGGSGQVSSRDGGTNNFYSVMLATPANTVVQGNLQTSPAPAPGMGGTLFARLPSNVDVPDEVAHMTGPP
jgi:hypothetical protein